MNFLKTALVLLVGFILGIGASQLWFRANPRARVTAASQPTPPPMAAPTPSPTPTPSPQAPQGKQDETKAALAQLGRMRAGGKYVRDADNPILQPRLKRLVDRSVDATMELRGAEYEQLLAGYGVDEATRAQLKQHMSDIYRYRTEIGVAQTGLLNAQIAYDNRMRQVLGSNYDDYLRNEDTYRSRIEVKSMLEYAAAENLSFPHTELERIQQLIQQHGAYGKQTLAQPGSPFDDAPTPIGGRWLEPKMEEIITQFSSKAAEVLVEANRQNLSAQSIDLLRDYFANQIAQEKMSLAKAKEGGIPALIRRLEHQLSETSEPTQAARLRDQLESVRKLMPPGK